MAAIDMSLVARSEVALHQLVKRKNWAAREPGVIVVFAIVGAVALLMICLLIQKRVRTPSIAHAFPGPNLTCASSYPLARPPYKDTPPETVMKWT